MVWVRVLAGSLCCTSTSTKPLTAQSRHGYQQLSGIPGNCPGGRRVAVRWTGIPVCASGGGGKGVCVKGGGE